MLPSYTSYTTMGRNVLVPHFMRVNDPTDIPRLLGGWTIRLMVFYMIQRLDSAEDSILKAVIKTVFSPPVDSGPTEMSTYTPFCHD